MNVIQIGSNDGEIDQIMQGNKSEGASFKQVKGGRNNKFKNF